jgi:hypothetical protein
MGGRLLEGPTMVGRTLDWQDELERWLKPFLDRLGHKARRRMCPLYVSGLIGPGDRKKSLACSFASSRLQNANEAQLQDWLYCRAGETQFADACAL